MATRGSWKFWNVNSIIARIAIAQVASTVISVQQSSTWSFAVERSGSRVLYITTWRTFGCSGRCPKDPKWHGHVLKPEKLLHKTRVFYKRDGNIRMGYESLQTSASKFLEYERVFQPIFHMSKSLRGILRSIFCANYSVV